MNIIKQLNDFENKYRLVIPTQYKEFLKIKNGISFNGGIVLYSLDELKQMNDDLQVQMYQHNYLAIGDDGGGLAFLMKQVPDAEEVICVDMSDYDIESPFYKVLNFSEWYKDGCQICVKEKEYSIQFSQKGNVFLIKMPINGTRDLIKIKKVFNLEISSSQLLALSKELPCLIVKDIKYAKAVKLMKQIGQIDIFEFRANAD